MEATAIKQIKNVISVEVDFRFLRFFRMGLQKKNRVRSFFAPLTTFYGFKHSINKQCRVIRGNIFLKSDGGLWRVKSPNQYLRILNLVLVSKFWISGNLQQLMCSGETEASPLTIHRNMILQYIALGIENCNLPSLIRTRCISDKANEGLSRCSKTS